MKRADDAATEEKKKRKGKKRKKKTNKKNALPCLSEEIVPEKNNKQAFLCGGYSGWPKDSHKSKTAVVLKKNKIMFE